MRKVIIFVIISIIFYYFFSVFFSKNGQFIQYFFSYSDSKKESIKKEIFLTDKLNVLVIKDSANIIKNNFNIWLDKSIITKQYGFLPIRFQSENNNFNSININLKPDVNDDFKKRISYKINGDSYKQYEMRSINVKRGEKVKVEFYFNKNLISIIKIVIPLADPDLTD
ncbi:hypothetical protein [Flavobacterium poyangense]|uniref:hypothetical protein n=1 Tax=Flavobacterium poyangense TaxID=2204302 RepID=UPI0014246EEA|nr:hypothetical protein [Flavobacterium sp. JXAS1]